MTKFRNLLRTPQAALFVLALAAYAYFYQAGGWNQNSRFDLTRSIVEDHSLIIDRIHRNTGDEAKRDNHFYCDKAPGVSLFAVPVWEVVYHAAGAPKSPTPRLLAIGAWSSTVIVVGIPSAIAVAMLFSLLLRLGLTSRRAAGVAVVWCIGTLAWPYATLMYGHQLIAALLMIAFAMLAEVAPGQASWRRLIGVGALLGTAVVVEYPAALIVAVLAVYALRAANWRRVLIGLALGGLLPALLLGAYHAAAFGSPMTLPYTFSTQKHRHLGWFMGLGKPEPFVIWSILGSSYRGLFYSSPELLLMFPGAVRWWRRGETSLVIACVAIALLFLWLNASLVDWQGGWAMGPRYLIPAIPFMVLLAAGMLLPTNVASTWKLKLGWLLGVVAVIGSAFAMLVGTAVKPEVPSAIMKPFQEYLLPHFYDGQLGISTQSIDMITNPDNGPHQAWNLGNALGFEGLSSLVPLMVAFAVCFLWLMLSTRVQAAARSKPSTKSTRARR